MITLLSTWTFGVALGFVALGVFDFSSNPKLAVVEGPSWPHPVVDSGHLWIRVQNSLLCYDLKKK
jgi:hypothetical protein